MARLWSWQWTWHGSRHAAIWPIFSQELEATGWDTPGVIWYDICNGKCIHV